ncbi:MAG: glutathione S-transferase N-terminal domain-containing protein [Gammaproteobacteria bacterium]|nr:glutathione S-transferase N-terminal domain-containing protein [Gammaproteobacteria bacterium]
MAIDLYYWPTPNGWKITLFLEEAGLDYRIVPVNIGRGEQFEPAFLRLSPNNRMPAIVDTETGTSVFESGAILVYLAEKTGQFLAPSGPARVAALEWLFWQVGGLGPMGGQLGHFRNYAQVKIDYAIERYANEYDRLLSVLERRLAEATFLAGDDYSIADMATWPWVHPCERLGQSLEAYPSGRRWFDAVAARPAVQRGLAAGSELRSAGGLDDEARRVLFGQKGRGS